MILFTLFYALGLGIIPWLVCSEVFASPVRGVGGGIATAVNWIANLAISATFLDLVVRALPLVSHWRPLSRTDPCLQRTVTASGSFWIYTAMAVLAWVFTYFRLPELNGISINDVHRAFGSGTSSGLFDERPAYQALPQQGSVADFDEEQELEGHNQVDSARQNST